MRKMDGNHILMALLKGRTFFVLILLLLFFSVKSPAFFTGSSLITVTKHVALYGILAIGMTFVIITGGIDLSVGSVVGLVGMIAGGLIFEGLTLECIGYRIYFTALSVMGIGLLLGMLFGLLNGVVITRCGVAPFIATLGTMYIARGLAMLRSNGATFQNLNGQVALGNTGFNSIGGSLLGCPIVVVIFIAMALAAMVVLRFTPLGWYILSVGGNPVASSLSGVKVKRVSAYVYIFSGFCAAVVGLITTAQLTAANPSSGEGWEMNAISAVVLGGTSMSGGVGSIGGTIIGAFVIGVIGDGMIMIGVSESGNG